MFSKGKSNTAVVAIIVTILVIVFGLIFLGGGCYFVSRFLSARDEQTATNETKTKAGWATYNNDEWGFSVQHPESFTKEVSANNDGATFTSTSPDITLRAFAVLSTDNTTDQYLSGILSLARESILYTSVTEISSQSANLGNITGSKKVWKYVKRGGKSEAEVRLAAINNGKMYNLSMTCDYSIYPAYMSLFEDMAATFKVN